MAKLAWIERKFQFDHPPEKMPDLIERVRGTPARVEERIAGLDAKVLTASDGQGWSIQTNVGHLLDLEFLATQRMDEILSGAEHLVAADMSNRKTAEADHDSRPIGEIISAFRVERGKLVAKMEALVESDWGKFSLHPRLKQPMRIVDIAYFHSEHDDYHLARISQLIRALT